jgi:hypothetical protein
VKSVLDILGSNMPVDNEVKKISQFEIELKKFHDSVPFPWREEIKEAHFIVMIYVKNRYVKLYNLGLLHKLLHFRKKGIIFADQIEVIKRNMGGRDYLDNTELFRIFQPEEMFIEQCNNIKKRREYVMKNKAKIYDGILDNINKKNHQKELF